MRTTHHLNPYLTGAVLALTSLFNASIADADSWTCADETLSPGTYGNVKVAAGTSCIIPSGVTITGNLSGNNVKDVTIGNDPNNPEVNSTDVTDVTIMGNVKVTNAMNVTIQGTDPGDNSTIADCESETVNIHGNVLVKSLTGNLKILDACINGDVRIKHSLAADPESHGIRVWRSRINSNVTIKNNYTGLIWFGSTTRGGNAIGGNVSVKGNVVEKDPFGSFIVVNSGLIGGDVEVKSNYTEQETGIYENEIEGDVTVKNNASADQVAREFFNGIRKNCIDGNLYFAGNQALVDPVRIDANVIDGNLTCKRNTPDPNTIPDLKFYEDIEEHIIPVCRTEDVEGNEVGGTANCFD